MIDSLSSNYTSHFSGDQSYGKRFSFDTIMTVAIASLALITAHLYDRKAPALSLFLRVCAGGIVLGWVIERCIFGRRNRREREQVDLSPANESNSPIRVSISQPTPQRNQIYVDNSNTYSRTFSSVFSRPYHFVTNNIRNFKTPQFPRVFRANPNTIPPVIPTNHFQNFVQPPPFPQTVRANVTGGGVTKITNPTPPTQNFVQPPPFPQTVRTNVTGGGVTRITNPTPSTQNFGPTSSFPQTVRANITGGGVPQVRRIIPSSQLIGGSQMFQRPQQPIPQTFTTNFPPIKTYNTPHIQGRQPFPQVQRTMPPHVPRPPY